MKRMIICVVMLLAFSVALSTTTVAQNQAGYAASSSTAGGSAIAANTAVNANTSAQINPGTGTTNVAQLANITAIFGPNKAEDINITQVNTTGGRWVEIANQGIATTNLSGWRLENRENFAYVIPNINLDPGLSIRVHEGSGRSNTTDLYTNSTEPLFSNSGDVITLLDAQGEIAAQYNTSGNVLVSTTSPAGAPLLVNATTPQAVKNPATQPVLLVPGTVNPVQNPSNAPVLITNPSQANITSNQTCPLGQTLCNGTCTDTSVDSQNCGSCGKVCPANAVCINGVCSAYPSPGAQ